jgi:hypothetical protein
MMLKRCWPRIAVAFLGGFLLFALGGSLSRADTSASSLYNGAAAEAAKISQSVPIEQRIQLYQRIFKNLDEITASYPDSPEALRLFTQQPQGTFNPSSLRSEFILDLSRYYNSVCEATPSYKCLGFVSLSMGMVSCQNARTFEDIDDAHRYLLNAARVFLTRRDDRPISNLTIAAYHQCLSGRQNLTSWQVDYFQSDLVKLLVQLGDQSAARAIIQNMSTPLFKFEGALTLRVISNEEVNDEFLTRMSRYIDETLSTSPSMQPQDPFIASINLSLFALKHSNRLMPIVAPSKVFSTCNQKIALYAFDLVLDLQAEVYKHSSAGDSAAYKPAVKALRLFIPCQTGEQNDLFLMSAVHGALLSQNSRGELASEFRKAIHERPMSREEVIDFYLRKSKPTTLRLVDEVLFHDNSGHGYSYKGSYLVDVSNRLGWDTQIFGNINWADNPAIMPAFRYLVDKGEICDAARILFHSISKTNRYNQAIKYIVESNSLDTANPPRCGDAELELLLKP